MTTDMPVMLTMILLVSIVQAAFTYLNFQLLVKLNKFCHKEESKENSVEKFESGFDPKMAAVKHLSVPYHSPLAWIHDGKHGDVWLHDDPYAARIHTGVYL